MKKFFRLIIILLLTAGVPLTTCTRNIKKYRSIKITAHDEFSLKSENMIKLIKAPLDPMNGTGTIEIIIYSYSSGAEVLEYSEENGFRQHYASGTMKAMIKFKRFERVKDVIFTSASGKNRAEIIRTLSENINSILSGKR